MRDNVLDIQDRYPLTAIILTRNESANIVACVQSLGWVDEIIVVDSGSTDNTPALAQDAGDNVRIFYNAFHDFGQQRNWAIGNSNPRNDWLLFLDADERSNISFEKAIRETLSKNSYSCGYYLCARNFLLGKWIRHSTLFPSWQLRLLKKGEVTFEKMGHGQREVTTGSVSYIHTPYDHFPFSKGVADWIDRHNKYSTEEAVLIASLRQQSLSILDFFTFDSVRRRRALKHLASKTTFSRPLLMFLYTYVFRMGFLDGRAGLLFAFLRSAHEAHNIAKVEEYFFANPSVLSPTCADDRQL
jgi:glycosyltransferase involved in cell wall biosynthesis